MLKIISLAFIVFSTANAATDEQLKARKVEGYIQTKEESAARIKYDCPATSSKFCKNQSSKCLPVYMSTSTKEECKKVDKQKIKRMCGKTNVTFYNSETECMNIKEAGDCPETLTNNFDIKNLHKCPTLYKKICNEVCGSRYDTTDIRAAWQIPQGNYAVICLDNSNEDIKNGVSYESDRQKHACLDDAETHIASGGTRSWCVKYDKTYNGRNLGAYLQCASKLK